MLVDTPLPEDCSREKWPDLRDQYAGERAMRLMAFLW
jgi:hypothetical protein